ncbi:hypothetical protein ARMSODRAFT_1026720 [Armillaria solidipes]|uniref:Uncharacterized protein n=1 Tax=Armillaria solidipes TaxID=1076256 RepID=A0A2H3B6W6_9AGAR|nr:hypothetical protein ARMSODRAFT_1026720 [Armillaria solidipes]
MNEAPRSSATWRSPYMQSPYGWETTWTWTWMESTSNEFDNFNYNYRTFEELDEVTPWMQRIDKYVPYPFTLPNSPPHQTQQHGQYYGLRTSFLMAGGNTGGSTQPPTDPLQLSNEERRQQAIELAELKLQCLEEKRQELEDGQRAYDTHIDFWHLPDKGKRPMQP